METLRRLWKHITTTRLTGQRLFPASTLQDIEVAITQGETRHRAELRLVIEHALDVRAVLAGVTSRERARELFSHYRVWDTEENCGVLVYINLADHRVEIVADRGVGHLVSQQEWQAICECMTQGFARGETLDSVLTALERLNALLHRLYPDDGSTRNQLPDRPVVL